MPVLPRRYQHMTSDVTFDGPTQYDRGLDHDHIEGDAGYDLDDYEMDGGDGDQELVRRVMQTKTFRDMRSKLDAILAALNDNTEQTNDEYTEDGSDVRDDEDQRYGMGGQNDEVTFEPEPGEQQGPPRGQGKANGNVMPGASGSMSRKMARSAQAERLGKFSRFDESFNPEPSSESYVPSDPRSAVAYADLLNAGISEHEAGRIMSGGGEEDVRRYGRVRGVDYYEMKLEGDKAMRFARYSGEVQHHDDSTENKVRTHEMNPNMKGGSGLYDLRYEQSWGKALTEKFAHQAFTSDDVDLMHSANKGNVALADAMCLVDKLLEVNPSPSVRQQWLKLDPKLRALAKRESGCPNETKF